MAETFFNPERSDEDMVSEWYNGALMGNPAEAANNLRKIQEVILHKNPHLLQEFFMNMLDFSTAKDNEVKKALIGFIEEACKLNENLVPKVMMSLLLLLNEGSVAVQKKVIQAAISLYKKLLSLICTAANVTEEMENAWKQMSEIKRKIADLIDSDNDGVRTSVVKFLECVVLLQSHPDPNDTKKNDFTLDNVPLTLKLLRRRKLEDEAGSIFNTLLKFNGSSHISNANLFVCIGALTNIAKNRPDYMGLVVQALVTLGSNLPPTLSTTQVNSVRKKLKSEFTALIKHPAGYDYVDKITPILLDSGYTQNEINKMVPKVDESKRYVPKRILHSTVDADIGNKAKRPKLENTEDSLENKQKKALELNEKFLKEKLVPNVAAEIVLKALPELPLKMPPSFKTDYAEVLKLGPSGSLEIVSGLLSELFVESGIGPGSSIIGKTVLLAKNKKVSVVVESAKQSSTKRPRDEEEKEIPEKKKVKVPKVKVLKLHEITKPLDRTTKEGLLMGAVRRLLDSKVNSRNAQIHQKIITIVAANFNDVIRDTVVGFICQNMKTNVELALAWLYEEYSIMQGFSRLPELRRSTRIDQSYSTLLSTFVDAAKNDCQVLTRIFLETPSITEQSLGQIKHIAKEEESCQWASNLLKQLVMRRPTKQLQFLSALMENITFENSVIRECTIKYIVELHKTVEIRQNIEEHMKNIMNYLSEPQPPDCLFGFAQGRLAGVDAWNEDIAKACLEGYIALLPSKQSLIHELGKVYVQTTSDVKRVILRLLENPVRIMGMDSPELLKLVQDCPKGAETLVTRVIHVLTDKGPPSTQLVKRVRDLYNSRVSDVRFLIPVLNGLTKAEIIAALPKLIKLNPVVVREVFNRLLGNHGECAISPTELLVTLHTLTSEQVDIKTQMKAITLCLNEKQVFTQEVLAVVLQQLLEQNPLPTLLMRTVIQALGLYPRLSGFVMTFLQKLILKQVWKQKLAWEGFVKCCQRTKPQSFPVMMQLPAQQLTDALSICPELKEPLKDYLLGYNDTQRAHVPHSIQELLLDTPHSKLPPPPPLSADAPPGVDEPLPPGMD